MQIWERKIGLTFEKEHSVGWWELLKGDWLLLEPEGQFSAGKTGSAERWVADFEKPAFVLGQLAVLGFVVPAENWKMSETGSGVAQKRFAGWLQGQSGRRQLV